MPEQSSYNAGQQLVLTATAATGSQFSGWIGDVISTTTPLTLTMDADKVITATFSEIITDTPPLTPTYSLDVSIIGNGFMEFSPAQTAYEAGTVVTVTAFANSGFAFQGWTGDVDGQSNPLVLLMDRHLAITATFEENLQQEDDTTIVYMPIIIR